MLNGISFALHPSNLFMCLLAIYTFLCRNAYANSLPIILLGIFFFFFLVIGVLNIFWISIHTK